jgi:2-oxoglutarate dehydrogenase complex dehydrogenase (E1) component-like enzyme
MPEARSSFDEMVEGSKFMRIYPEDGPAKDNHDTVKKLLFCSGKVYYELLKEREKKNLVNDIAIARIEQVSESHNKTEVDSGFKMEKLTLVLACLVTTVLLHCLQTNTGKC